MDMTMTETILTENIRKGAALKALQIAELLTTKSH
jgi:aspartate-semialdehyde dehydrogenase